MAEIKLTRLELYNLVWNESMLALSKKYNISDVGLRKICKKMKIPTPPNGYWAKLQFGKPTTRLKLPTTVTGDIEIILYSREESITPFGLGDPVTILQKQLENDSRLPLRVPDTLKNPDTLIIKARGSLSSKKASKWSNWLVSTSVDELDITVSPSNVSRSLRIFDTLIKVLRIRGHDVVIGYRSTVAKLEGEEFKIKLKEKCKREVDKESTSSWTEYKYSPTDILAFKVDTIFYQREWTEGRQKLEEMLPRIIAKLELTAIRLRDERIARDRYWAEQKELDRRREDLIKLKEKELENFKRLILTAERWHKAAFLRDFIKTKHASIIESGKMTDDMANWLDWAVKKADWYDPLTEAYDDIMQEVDRDNLSLDKKAVARPTSL